MPIATITSLWRRRERHPIRSGFGAALAIAAIVVVAGAIMGRHGPLPYIIAPLGASAVLAFAIPASPLAQPRAIIGGNVVSALVGLAVTHLVRPPELAMALSVGLAIYAMQKLRCLHPPGGAVALLPALAPHVPGFGFALAPVGLNSLVLVIAAIVFNALAGSRYPHKPAPEPVGPAVFAYERADLEAVLAQMDDLPDIELSDLDEIIRLVQARMMQRLRQR